MPSPPPHDRVTAAVLLALKPGASATPEELRAFARDKIAAYKYPRQIWLVGVEHAERAQALTAKRPK